MRHIANKLIFKHHGELRKRLATERSFEPQWSRKQA
jgi:hypothetical protein